MCACAHTRFKTYLVRTKDSHMCCGTLKTDDDFIETWNWVFWLPYKAYYPGSKINTPMRHKVVYAGTQISVLLINFSTNLYLQNNFVGTAVFRNLGNCSKRMRNMFLNDEEKSHKFPRFPPKFALLVLHLKTHEN